jgi:hypothetical protein
MFESLPPGNQFRRNLLPYLASVSRTKNPHS